MPLLSALSQAGGQHCDLCMSDLLLSLFLQLLLQVLICQHASCSVSLYLFRPEAQQLAQGCQLLANIFLSSFLQQRCIITTIGLYTTRSPLHA